VSGDPDTRQLHDRQLERERQERERARSAEDERETAAHARRAEKSAYLREKLAEREQSERGG
jgi:hypothetical protein